LLGHLDSDDQGVVTKEEFERFFHLSEPIHHTKALLRAHKMPREDLFRILQGSGVLDVDPDQKLDVVKLRNVERSLSQKF
jgi:hypothetical protein